MRGDDLRQDLPKKTYYRYRAELLKYDIDIANVQDVDKPSSKVIPLLTILQAQPADIPTWAYDLNLIAC